MRLDDVVEDHSRHIVRAVIFRGDVVWSSRSAARAQDPSRIQNTHIWDIESCTSSHPSGQSNSDKRIDPDLRSYRPPFEIWKVPNPSACGCVDVLTSFDISVDLHPREVRVESPLANEFVVGTACDNAASVDD